MLRSCTQVDLFFILTSYIRISISAIVAAINRDTRPVPCYDYGRYLNERRAAFTPFFNPFLPLATSSASKRPMHLKVIVVDTRALPRAYIYIS